MEKNKGGGKTDQHINPSGKRLGLKVTHGQTVIPGRVLVRQRGTVLAAGDGGGVGRGHTLFATIEGKVSFGKKLGKKFVAIQAQN